VAQGLLERFGQLVQVVHEQALGAEGAGLSRATRAAADVEVRIPMAAGVDSLNVAAACGIALHRLA